MRRSTTSTLRPTDMTVARHFYAEHRLPVFFLSVVVGYAVTLIALAQH